MGWTVLVTEDETMMFLSNDTEKGSVAMIMCHGMEIPDRGGTCHGCFRGEEEGGIVMKRARERVSKRRKGQKRGISEVERGDHGLAAALDKQQYTWLTRPR